MSEGADEGASATRVPLVFPAEYADLTAEKERLSGRVQEINRRRSELRKAAVEAAGWKRCCRCWPRAVGDDGFCGCCNYHHVTGTSMDFDLDDEDHPGNAAEPPSSDSNPAESQRKP